MNGCDYVTLPEVFAAQELWEIMERLQIIEYGRSPWFSVFAEYVVRVVER